MSDLQVLHVDDEPDMRLLVQLSLGLDAGISTRSASSGTEALDATTYWKPDVILLDALMPGMDGLATLKALQANPKTAGIPVLFLTAKCSASDLDSFKASGSAGVIGKPFNPQTLAAAIRGYVQATSIASAEAGSTPDFIGRSPDSAGVAHGSGAGFALPGSAAFGTLGSTAEALLLDGNGNAFALTITDHLSDRTGASSLAGGAVHAAPIAATADPAASAFTLHVEPLDANTVSDLLGPDAVALLSGDEDHAAATDWTAFEGATFKMDHAIGWTSSGGSLVDRPQSDVDALHHLGSLDPHASTDLTSFILPRAFMH